MDITQLLTFAHREGASDVHLSSGEPPMVRMHGDMKRIVSGHEFSLRQM